MGLVCTGAETQGWVKSCSASKNKHKRLEKCVPTETISVPHCFMLASVIKSNVSLFISDNSREGEQEPPYLFDTNFMDLWEYFIFHKGISSMLSLPGMSYHASHSISLH